MARRRNRSRRQPVAKADGVKTSAPVSAPKDKKVSSAGSRIFFVGTGSERKAPDVTPENAKRIATVWACWNVLSQDISTLPISLMRRVGSDTEVVSDHPAAAVVANPNPLMTTAEWRAYGIVRLLAHGNWLDQIIYDGNGRPLQIWPLCNDKAGLQFDDKGDPWWLYRTDRVNGGVAALPYSHVLHVRGMSTDGWLGLSPIAAHRKMLGWTLAAEEFGLSFFVNGATSSGVVSFPDGKMMSDEAFERFRRQFSEQHAGAGNAHKPIILEEGATFSPISIPADQAQFLETLKYQRSVTCGIYRVPAHMVNDLERATFSNIEEQGIMYVSHTLNPWCVLIEQRLNKSLLTAEERASGYFFKHNLRGLMRGKFAEQMSSFATGIQNGIYNPNGVREMLDMNGYEGGEVYTRNTASQPVDALKPNGGSQ